MPMKQGFKGDLSNAFESRLLIDAIQWKRNDLRDERAVLASDFDLRHSIGSVNPRRERERQRQATEETSRSAMLC